MNVRLKFRRPTRDRTRGAGIGAAWIVGFVLLSALLVPSAVDLRAGCVHGVVIDSESGEPVEWATIEIQELDRSESARGGGLFMICNVPSGTYTLVISHVGYRSAQQTFDVGTSDTSSLYITLETTSLQADVSVTAERRNEALSGTGTTRTISGAKLQQQLGRTLAETLEDEPGVATRSMGPAAARPVVRGLGGDRLMILEDGSPTGDASAMSPDHAVAADPMSAERIEVLRGPASFVYSSNALGGIINLQREKSVSGTAKSIHGTAGLQGESVSTGISAGASIGLPLGPFGITMQGSYRIAADIETPTGRLDNTQIETGDGSLGVTWPFERGSVKLSGGYYSSLYGIPGGFPGAHADGVEVDMNRSEFGGHGEYYPEGSFVRRIVSDLDFTRYHHQELESNDIVGTEYGILTTTLGVRVHHDSIGQAIDHGIASVQAETIDFAANGVRIPHTDRQTIGLSLFEEKSFGPLSLSGALRFDAVRVTPRESDSTNVGIVDERTFSGLSGALGVSYDLSERLSVGTTLLRTFRAPTIEELFSDGPHLAAFSYDVGNSSLGPETGLSAEIFGTYATERGHIRITGFQNSIDDYVFPEPTGDTNARTGLPLYRYYGEPVQLMGAELETEWEISEAIVASANASYVQGRRTEGDEPLPAIPPLHGSLGLRYHTGPFFAGATLHATADQNRVSEFERPTDGSAVLDMVAQYRITTTSLLHTIVLSVDNVLNTTYRNHLARTKELFPEAARNLKLLYRLYF